MGTNFNNNPTSLKHRLCTSTPLPFRLNTFSSAPPPSHRPPHHWWHSFQRCLCGCSSRPGPSGGDGLERGRPPPQRYTGARPAQRRHPRRPPSQQRVKWAPAAPANHRTVLEIHRCSRVTFWPRFRCEPVAITFADSPFRALHGPASSAPLTGPGD